MYENCMLILGLEGVKLHGSAGEQILSLSVKNYRVLSLRSVRVFTEGSCKSHTAPMHIFYQVCEMKKT